MVYNYLVVIIKNIVNFVPNEGTGGGMVQVTLPLK